ncbi:uncharacterized protein LOC141680570 [Apium graveolens]|uniref:uncharacterized protein LOC141680570 n=1 Tax=Apium graveolens TaxID=4045 RepID=UPI003D7B204D
MSILGWNCHGLGTPWAFQFLKEIVLQKKPDLVFISEILCKQVTVEKFIQSVDFEGSIVVESQGHNGGIALIWRNRNEVTLQTYNKNHIDVKVRNKDDVEFRVTGLYGEPDRRKRDETWSLIRMLSSYNTLPWCLIGDMNNVLSQADKQGGRPYPQHLIQGFRDVVEDCNLTDMDLISYPFTWERASGTADHVEVRLDRALVKRFRFENAWLREPMCQKIVEEVWSSGMSRSFYEKLEECSKILSSWGKDITGSFKNRIHQCKRAIKFLKGRRDDLSLATLKKEQKQLSEIYAQQEVFWRQRSKQLWLREGDRNSKFFYASTKNMRALNHIRSLKNNDGNEVQWNNGLEEVITGYFSNLFQASSTEWT